jgi:hypothetical protein
MSLSVDTSTTSEEAGARRFEDAPRFELPRVTAGMPIYVYEMRQETQQHNILILNSNAHLRGKILLSLS